MRITRNLALVVLWLLAAAGAICGLAGIATSVGLVKPLIVISGSMEPGIMTGDLLIDTQVDTASLEVGDVVSLPSDLTDDLVTHRIETIEDLRQGEYRISMKGDNNEVSDALDYFVGSTVWRPQAQLGAWGFLLQNLTTPAVAVPLVVGLLGLLGLTALIPATEGDRRPAEGDRRPAEGDRRPAEGAVAPSRLVRT